MVSSCSIWSLIFKTVFVFDVRPFLLLSVKFFGFNGNFNGKMTQINKMAKNRFSGFLKGSQSFEMGVLVSKVVLEFWFVAHLALTCMRGKWMQAFKGGSSSTSCKPRQISSNWTCQHFNKQKRKIPTWQQSKISSDWSLQTCYWSNPDRKTWQWQSCIDQTSLWTVMTIFQDNLWPIQIVVVALRELHSYTF